MSKFTVYISPTLAESEPKKLAVPYYIEQEVKDNISDFLKNNEEIKKLEDDEYDCIVCRDSMLDPDSVTTMKGLADNNAYVASVNFKIENQEVKIL